MTTRTAALACTTVLMLAGALLAGCGSGPAKPAKPVRAGNGARYDTIDVCALATQAELSAALGEAPGPAQPKQSDAFKGCSYDGSSERFSLFLTVQRSPGDGRSQFDYNWTVASAPAKLGGVGDDAFTYTTDDRAHVEALQGDLVVGASLIFYAGGGTPADTPGLLDRLKTLVKQLLTHL